MTFALLASPSDRRRPSSTRPPLRALTAAAALLLLSGCGILGGAEEAEILPEGTTEVELGVGESAQVSLGDGSQGIGDSWGVISQSEEDVSSAEVVMGEDVIGAEAGEDKPGSSTPFAVELTGRAPGTTTVRVLYCTRTAVAEGCDQSQGTLDAPVDPVEITVTVR